MHGFLGLTPGGLAADGAVVLVGALVRGYSGFGFSAVLMAGLSLNLQPAEIVPIAIALEVLASIGQASRSWRAIDWRRLWVILATGLVGNPVGVAILVHLPAGTMRTAVRVFTAAASAALLGLPRLNVPVGPALLACAGLAAGIVNGATALSGLVLALFLTDLWAGLLLAREGLFDAMTIRRVLASVPLLGIGLWLGGRAFAGTSPDMFRKATLGVLIMLSLAGLVLR